MRTTNEPFQCDLTRDEFDAMVAAANRGNPEALERLRELLEAKPDLRKSLADLGSHYALVLISLIAGNNVLLRESVLLQVAEMEAELAPEDATVLQAMTARQVINNWLFLSYLEMVCPTPESRQELQRHEAAQRLLDRAVRTWKTITSARSKKVLPRPLRVVG
jgi:hypothetical protein